ncbi:MAG TPA: AMP-binding protein, partial [Longimicrobiaceae bacterium]|nr:AMP-binding protein [Longimicrobiaceae bacterium]
LIGLFANTLAIRADLSGDPTFRELLARVRETTFEDFANQDLPFEKLVEGLKIERSLSYNPVFQVLLVVQNAPLPKSLLPGLDAGQLDVGHRKAKLDLALTLVETPEGMFGGWEYSTELVDRDTMVRIHDHFVTLLRGVAEDPDRRLSELPLITPEERTRVLYTWNEGAGVEPARLPVHRDFEARAALTPDAVAVRYAGESLTYAELSRRSSRLARHLRARGVGPESRVGVCLERGPETVVALLGILKAGAAYVPLDPAYPRERLAFMVQDSGIAVVLTETALFASLPGNAAAEAVFLDGDRERIAEEEGTDPEVPVDPDCAAYVIYTSGSTGKPKGVVVPHRTLAWFVAAAREVYGITAADTVLQFASMNFDTSVEEIFPTLLSGGRLVLRTGEMLDSARIFLDTCREWGITVLDLPTAYWHELVAELSAGGGAELPPEMRIVIVGGERALPERLRAWRERFGESVRLVNGYGPTETTVVATVADLTVAPEEEPGTTSLRAVPIGRPLPHARVYVL